MIDLQIDSASLSCFRSSYSGSLDQIKLIICQQDAVHHLPEASRSVKNFTLPIQCSTSQRFLEVGHFPTYIFINCINYNFLFPGLFCPPYSLKV